MVYGAIFIVIIFLDQYTKSRIKKFPMYETKEMVKNKLYLRHVKNKGAFLGKGSKHPKIVTVFSISIFAAMFLYLLKDKSLSRFGRLSLVTALAGGMGNIIDRIRDGQVTDFLMFKKEKTPIWNIADLFVFFGAFLYMVSCVMEIKNSLTRQ